MRIKLLLAGAFSLGLLVLTSEIAAQNALRGKVFEEVTTHEGQNHSPGQDSGAKPEYEPLPGAYVHWAGTEELTATDRFGFFKIPAGEERVGDTLQISMVGFSTAALVYSGQDYVEIPMEAGVALEAAEVTGERAATSFNLLDPMHVQSLNRKELTRAACCNLSEAFETNASVDASFTDAVTGTKQIRMLGLDGKYTQIQIDNLPGPRGLSVVQGLMFIPGDWVDAINISKGAGSVTGGHESITGQINVALRNPDSMVGERAHFNTYGNASGRLEWNHVSAHDVSRKWRTGAMSHVLWNKSRNDRNEDGFLDTPLQHHVVLRNEWKYRGDRGIRGEYAVTAVQSEVAAGQNGSWLDQPWSELIGSLSRDEVVEGGDSTWAAVSRTQRIELSAKTGFVFPQAEWRSIGSQFFYAYHDHNQRFGAKPYTGRQSSFNGKILFADKLGNTNHKITAGVSYLLEQYEQSAQTYVIAGSYRENFWRSESVPGVFAEYTFNDGLRWSIIGGLRFDQHNLYGNFLSPRLHARFSATENVSLKFAAGRGFRTPNAMMEQLGTWASNRTWYVVDGDDETWIDGSIPYGGFLPEVATNVGLNLTAKFRLGYRDASLALDVYQTTFKNRLIVDLDKGPQMIGLYSSEAYGLDSWSRSVQGEFDWSLHRRVDMRLAYRLVDTYTDRLGTDETQDPFVPRHRAFSQWGYESRLGEGGDQWRGDLTIQWIGEQRLPSTASNSEPNQRSDMAEDFTQVNFQVTRQFNEAWSLYGGVENLMNVRQDRPIISADNPQGSEFDASIVYGPIFGRMIYGGLRWALARPE